MWTHLFTYLVIIIDKYAVRNSPIYQFSVYEQLIAQTSAHYRYQYMFEGDEKNAFYFSKSRSSFNLLNYYILLSAVPKQIYLKIFFMNMIKLFLKYRILIQQGKSKVKAQDKDGFSPIHRCCQEPPMPRYFIKGYCKQNR